MSLVNSLKKKGAKLPKKVTTPLWKGPSEDGITFSLLSRFLVCRERFRLLVVEGLKSNEGFNHRLEYGQMWHTCEEELARTGNKPPGPANDDWCRALLQYAKGLGQQYPLQREEIEKWYNVCRIQFPLYVKYWSEHPDVTNRTPLLQEEAFSVPYKLPSGRTVRLRGKWDSVDLVKEGKQTGVWLQENKSKGDIRPEILQRQLRMDLQTMLYLVALEAQYPADMGMLPLQSNGKPYPILGVRYNVVRRPLSGGKGTIVQHKPSKSNPQGETKEEYYERLRGILEGCPNEYFMRWKCLVTPTEVLRFRQRCLDPILEQLCDWWYWITMNMDDPFCGTKCKDPVRQQIHAALGGVSLHWQHPFGVYNVLNEGGYSDLDEYLETGSEVGLKRTKNLFPELP